jgi:hypothetical protein
MVVFILRIYIATMIIKRKWSIISIGRLLATLQYLIVLEEASSAHDFSVKKLKILV